MCEFLASPDARRNYLERGFTLVKLLPLSPFKGSRRVKNFKNQEITSLISHALTGFVEVSLSLHSFFCQTHSHPNYPGSDDQALRVVHLGNAGREMVQSYAKNQYKISLRIAKTQLFRGCLSICCQKIKQ